MRLPTGELLGRLASKSGRTTRMRSGSISSTSPTTVAASVSWPWPDEVVWIVTVMCPSPSTMMRQESIQVVVVFFGLSSGSNDELPPLGSRHAAMPMPASIPDCAQAVALALQRRPVDMRQHLVDHRMIVAAVVARAARDQIGELVAADEIAPPHLDAGRVRSQRRPCRSRSRSRNWSATGRSRAPPPARPCWSSPRAPGTARSRSVRADDRADRLAELERRASRIGADIVERAHLHRADDAGIVERDRTSKMRSGPVLVARAHVVEPVLDQPHRPAELRARWPTSTVCLMPRFTP